MTTIAFGGHVTVDHLADVLQLDVYRLPAPITGPAYLKLETSDPAALADAEVKIHVGRPNDDVGPGSGDGGRAGVGVSLGEPRGTKGGWNSPSQGAEEYVFPDNYLVFTVSPANELSLYSLHYRAAWHPGGWLDAPLAFPITAEISVDGNVIASTSAVVTYLPA